MKARNDEGEVSDRPYPKCCEELDAYQSSAAEIQDELERLRATLTAVREWRAKHLMATELAMAELDAILAGEGEVSERLESSIRELNEWKARAEAAEGEVEHLRRKLAEALDGKDAVATLQRARAEAAERERDEYKQAAAAEACPTCGGTDREGGTVATMGPDEFGNYDTDDCPDGWHT